MVKAKIQVGKLRRALQSVGILVNSATVQFGEDALTIETVDPSNVGAVSMTLYSEAFEEYTAEGGEASIDIDRISNILQNFNNDQIVEFEQGADGCLDLEVSIDTFEFELSLIHRDSVESGQRAAEIQPPSHIEIEANEIQKAMNLGEMFSEEIILGVDPDADLFYINSIGDNDSMAVSFKKSSKKVESLQASRAHSVFSHSILSKMLRTVPSTNDVKISLGEQYPAKIQFNIAGEDGEVEYGLAPRVT